MNDNPFIDSNAETAVIPVQDDVIQEQAQPQEPVVDTAAYVEVPDMHKAFKPAKTPDWVEGLSLWFVFLAIFGIEVFRRARPVERFIGWFRKASEAKPLRTSFALLVVAAFLFDFPKILGRENVTVSVLKMLALSFFTILNAGAVAMRIVELSKRHKVFLHAPAFRPQGLRYLLGGLLAITISAALFLLFTESSVAVSVLWTTSFVFGYFFFATFKKEVFEADFKSAPYLSSSVQSALVGIVGGLYPIVIIGAFMAGRAFAGRGDLFKKSSVKNAVS